MKVKLKQMWLGVALLLSIGLIAGCGSKAEKNATESGPKEVKIGIIRVPNDKQVAIAEEYFDAYFKEKGIDTTFIFFDSGVAANQAFSSGSIDFAEMGYTNAVVALATDIPVKLIWLHEILGANEALVVQKESGISDIAKLTGKKVATPFSSTSHYSLLNALEQAGIADEVTLLDMQTSEIVAAWERGDIDAAYTWEPTLSALKEQGTVLIDSQALAEAGYLTANVDLVHADFAEKYPALVADYLAVLNKGVNFYQSSAEKAAAAVAKPLEITPEEALKQMDATTWLTSEEQISPAYLGTTAEPGQFHQVFMDTAIFLEAQGSIAAVPSEADVNGFIDSSFAEASIKQ